MSIDQMSEITGRIIKDDGTIINQANTIKEIKTGINANVTMDSFRSAVIDGNAYKMGYADFTGITAGTSYYYWVKNTSETKSIWLRPLSFNSGTLGIRVVKGGTFQVGGVDYNPNDYIDMENVGTLTEGSPYISGIFDTALINVGMFISGAGIPAKTIVGAVTSSQITMSAVATASGTDVAIVVTLPTMLSRNLNNSSANESALKIWYQNVLGTITYADSAIDQMFNVTDYEMQDPDPTDNANVMNILAPGTEFMVILTNYGAEKIPYKIAAKWADV